MVEGRGTPGRVDNMRRIVAVLVILMSLTVTLVGASPGTPDREGMLSDLDLLLGWGDRASGSANEKNAAKLIADRFRELGLQVETQNFTERGVQSQNVIGIKPGSEPRAGVITVTAHYDSASPGIPGANDNGSGTVVMMELARLWADRVTSSTIQFIAFGAEERGLLGAQYYVNSPQAESVVLNLNLDMVGQGGKVGLDRAPAWLITAIAQSSRKHDYPFVLHYGTMAAMRVDGSPTDGRPFASKGIPTVTFTSAEGLEDHNYHQPADNRANVHGDDLLRIAVVVDDLLERYDGQRVPWGDRHFIAFSLLGRLVVIPGWVSYLFIAAALLAWLALFSASMHDRGGHWRNLGRAAVRWIVMVLAVELVAILRYRLIPGPGYPWHYLIALLASFIICWLADGRSDKREDQGRAIMLTAIGFPVALALLCLGDASWDYAFMAALAILPATAVAVSNGRWNRLAWWTTALVAFLYLSASNWLPRAGTIRLILEFAYIPSLAMMAAQVVRGWARVE